jgi:hypothetical protein
MIFEDFESEVISLLEAKSNGLHKTLRGKFVKVGTDECRADIQARIEDITHHRNTSPHRSDARTYYTGLLRVLGRQLRENDRIMSAALQEKERLTKKTKRLKESADDKLSEQFAARIMRLAGINR